MPALGYKKQFVHLVKSGRKPHSIRALRKRQFKVGDILMHYFGMRTKQCRKIRKDTGCVGATVIFIDAVHGKVWMREGSYYYKAGLFSDEALHLLARRDGFKNIEEFFRFFLRNPDGKFTGQLIEWRS